MKCYNITASEAQERDRAYESQKTRCVAAALPLMNASERVSEACKIVAEGTNMSSVVFWTSLFQAELDLEKVRAQCLKEAHPEVAENDRDQAFKNIVQEARRLSQRHQELKEKWELQNYHVVQRCAQEVSQNVSGPMRAQLMAEYERFLNNDTIHKVTNA
ncbi:unnamed protein product, partial [Ixodes hexagonus]